MRPFGSSAVEQSRYYENENPIFLRTGCEARSHAVLNNFLQGHWFLFVTFTLIHIDELQSVLKLSSAHLLPGCILSGGTTPTPPHRPFISTWENWKDWNSLTFNPSPTHSWRLQSVAAPICPFCLEPKLAVRIHGPVSSLQNQFHP